MSEQTGSTTATDGTDSQQQQEQVKEEFQAIESQEDFDKAIQARIARERAKFSNYDQLKADAAELAQIKESQKTEAQKATERQTELERENAELKVSKLRADVAEAKSDPEKGLIIPASLLSGSTQEELEKSADALIAFRGEQGGTSRLHVEDEGNKGARSTGDWLRDAIN